jgi:membrane protease YdiL (CAAX protease family)
VQRLRLWTPFAAFGAYLGGTLMMGFFVGILAFVLSVPLENFSVLLLLLALSVGTAGVVAITAAALSPTPLVDRLQLRIGPATPASIVIGVLGACSIGLCFTGLINIVAEFLDLTKLLSSANFLSGLSDVGWLTMAAALLVIAVGAGVGEELLFRGYIQSRLTTRLGAGWSVVITSMLFSFAHLNLVQSPFALVLGLYLGRLTVRAGTIWPAILAHIANNAMALFLVRFGIDNAPTRIWLYITLAACFAAGVCWIALERLLAPQRLPTPAMQRT